MLLKCQDKTAFSFHINKYNTMEKNASEEYSLTSAMKPQFLLTALNRDFP